MSLLAPTRAGSADSGTAVVQTAGESASLIPALQLHVRRIPWHIAQGFVREHHYLHMAPIMCSPSFGVFASDALLASLVGVIVYGKPASASEDQDTTLELRRMVILDVTERNAESRCIGYTVRWLRKHRPEITRLIAYADPSAGHEGTIYKASGWQFVKHVPGCSWSGRKGRPNRRITVGTDKLKYEKVIR